MKNVVITISGPSGSGKSTLERKLSEMDMFKRVISTTTRPMRDGEVNGVDYKFIDDDEFHWLIDANEFVDYKVFNDNWYGATFGSFNEILNEKKVAVVVVEPGGAKNIKEFGDKNGWRVLSLFIDGDPEVLTRRYLDRVTPEYFASNVEDVTKRLVSLLIAERSWSAAQNWDVSLEYFDESNENDVVSFIVNHATSLKELGMSQHTHVVQTA